MPSEFDLIQNLKSKYGLRAVGDDCAVLPKDELCDQLLTADLLVEDIDFKRGWAEPILLGHKALAVSLSDIAAMGGWPAWAMLTIGVPGDVWESKFIDDLYEGWHALAGEFGVELVGGDISRTPERIVIDSIVGGEAPRGKAVLRSTARTGDLIFVSGYLGGAAAGLDLLHRGFSLSNGDEPVADELILRQLAPRPRLLLGRELMNSRLATSMIDLSDGLASDLGHICRLSGVGAYIESIPADPGISSYFSSEESINMALGGGEDFELLFTVAAQDADAAVEFGAHYIGTVSDQEGLIELGTSEGSKKLNVQGFSHF